jgi:hypothetical protein
MQIEENILKKIEAAITLPTSMIRSVQGLTPLFAFLKLYRVWRTKRSMFYPEIYET